MATTVDLKTLEQGKNWINSKIGSSNVESVDVEVLQYVVSVLCDTNFSSGEVVPVITPFLQSMDPVLSLDDCNDLILTARQEILGEVGSDEAIVATRDAPLRLAAPKRLGDAAKNLQVNNALAKVNVGGGNANQTLDRSKEAAASKDVAQARKERRAGKIGGRIMEETKATVSALKMKIQIGSKDVKVEGIDLSFGGLPLLENAALNLSYGRRYGVVGRNGIGKSTLMKAIARRELPIPQEVDVLYVEQEVTGDDTTPLESVLRSDKKLVALQEEERLLTSDAPIDEDKPLLDAEGNVIDRATRLEQVYRELEDIGAESATGRASSILSGLGFDTDMQNKPSKEFSGGWRMRIALAQALFCEPLLLLLDEPTNHLDLHTVLWLSDYLNQWPHTVVVVSHDRDFLNDVCTDIIYVRDKQLHPYSGNYDDFEQTRAEKLKDLVRTSERDEMRKKHLQKFVDRFRYNAKRAQMAQSRIKMIQKMDENKVVLPGEEDEFSFTFPEPGALAGSHGSVQLANVKFGYHHQHSLPHPDELHNKNAEERTEKPLRIIFENLDFCIDTDSRIALVGPNGAGKSTVIKLITGENVPLEGEVKKSQKIRIGYFSQHHIDQLVLWRTPIEHLKVLFPQATIPEIRGHLGQMGVKDEMGLRPINTLSGGQKSRVAFAVITWQKPHILLLDEPSNHLDIETIDALVEALNAFSGGVVLVSHDARLISTVCDEIHICKDGKLSLYPEDFREYRRQLLKTLNKAQFKKKQRPGMNA